MNNTNDKGHTELLPFRLGGCCGRMIYDAGNSLVADVDTMAHARLIRDSVNNHYKLVEGIKQASQKIRNATDHIKRMEGFTSGMSSSEDFADAHCIDALNILNAILAEAEGLKKPATLNLDKALQAATEGR